MLKHSLLMFIRSVTKLGTELSYQGLNKNVLLSDLTHFMTNRHSSWSYLITVQMSLMVQ